MKEFEPTIISFLCNWCSYASADNAGRARIPFPPNLRIIRVMCSGRVDPQFILNAFKQGADGVIIIGCHPGECHYKEGNYYALRIYHFLRRLLGEFGIEEERFRLDWVSSSESKKFVKVVTEMAEKIKSLGPLSSRKDSGA